MRVVDWTMTFTATTAMIPDQTQTNPHPHQKGQRAAPDVPDNACSQHWKAGRNATYCTDPLNCDWVRIIAPRVPKST